jgi:hypothetical protein
MSVIPAGKNMIDRRAVKAVISFTILICLAHIF